LGEFLNSVFHVILENRKFSWEDNSIKFIENGQMDAFGIGFYTQLDAYKFQATFGGIAHTLLFNDDYTEFTSIRDGDAHIVKGKLL